ncbi:Crp/Fnr family transcriptional regulator [Actinacidiphila sp. bgisy144]|uniref:Crp/Fnr family transcriptional regulator n=1 Tax=Actinacidiphila sp. bgisy144 TaxID=3413791 RepID=UPI003EB9F5D6
MTYRSEHTRHAKFLDTLSHEERAAFSQLGTPRLYAGGELLMREGEHVPELMVLHEGLVKVTARLDDQRVALLDIRMDGDIVGEFAVMDFGPRSATVTACGPVTATVVQRRELEPANPTIWKALCFMVAFGARRSVRWRLDFGGQQVDVRLARVLVELAESYGRPDPGRPGSGAVLIDVDLSQSEFAELIGSTRNTVHKHLAQLRHDRIISTGDRRTYVRDLRRLREKARLCVPVDRGREHGTGQRARISR